ncbi:hypothetical protein ASE16_12265 [Leifsonia sp. Root227]|uniref:DUF6114 domain-containing protein n=1 Tax=Leifsonia sp. Root227 TaxID=1736496 RepID=UPI0006FE9FEB|nr:DUF6114 domain-containing protein [Leifsonia sp. Root227]KRC49503.1 hypothetical protein ASE16_12265 [Leifsonia sp. Root227]
MLLNAAERSTRRRSERSERSPSGSAWSRFSHWRRQRPFLGGLLIALGGIELFFSGQLDIGKIHVQLGIEGLQATIIPIVLVLLGVLIVLMPAHRIFYGVIALVVAVYSLVGVNLGGFFVGMLLSTVGGVLAVAWMPRVADSAAITHVPTASSAADPSAEAAGEGSAS